MPDKGADVIVGTTGVVVDGNAVKVDPVLSEGDAKDYDGLVLPGGQMNPDSLRLEPKAIELMKAFAAAGSPVAAVATRPGW